MTPEERIAEAREVEADLRREISAAKGFALPPLIRNAMNRYANAADSIAALLAQVEEMGARLERAEKDSARLLEAWGLVRGIVTVESMKSDWYSSNEVAAMDTMIHVLDAMDTLIDTGDELEAATPAEDHLGNSQAPLTSSSPATDGSQT
jgi:hypothetical protein